MQNKLELKVRAASRELHARIVADLQAVERFTYRQISIRQGCTEKTVALVAKASGLMRRKPQTNEQEN